MEMTPSSTSTSSPLNTINTTEPAPNAPWVAAAPFRAHAHNLMGIGGLTVDDLAALTGLTAALLQHLLHGRDGRPLRRVSPETARRLWRVTQTDVHALPERSISTVLAREPYERLRESGWPDEVIARRVGVQLSQLADLRMPDRQCSLLLGVRLTAVAHRAELTAAQRRRTALAGVTATSEAA